MNPRVVATFRPQSVLRSYMLPLAVGAAIFAADHTLDSVVERLHLSQGVSVAEDILLALLVASIVYVLQQRFELASAQLKNFASEVAHQLRTPLTIQRTIGEVALQRTMTKVEYRETLDSMMGETHNLIRLVEALLLISRMDSGQIHLVRTRFPIADFVRDVANELDVLAQDKLQLLTVDTNDDAFVEADPAMLRQVLMNLLSNAIKYTPEGGRISILTRTLPANIVEIAVSDNGPGIHPNDQERIFERFYRSGGEGDGTGLGLSISKWIVEAHKGRIYCKSSTGEGCRFTVHIPRSKLAA